MLSRSLGALIGSVLRLMIAVAVPGAGPRMALALGTEKGYSSSKVGRMVLHSPRYGIGTALFAVAFLPGTGAKALGIFWGVAVYFGNYLARLGYLDAEFEPGGMPLVGSSSAGLPAGWYPDPWNVAASRYWDGSAWTGHVG